MTFTVAIVGRPNVGKSTLFNRLVGRRAALVDDTPGVTRDRREGQGRLGSLRFRVIDTAGLEEADPKSLEGRMRLQTDAALEEADVALFMIDAREGLTPTDRHFAEWLRRSRTPVVLVANKSEGRAAALGAGEAYALGFGDPLPISAEHAEGLVDLYEALAPFERDGDDEKAGEKEAPLRLAIVGRPNAGKSTLVNRLLGEERMLTGPEPGITRDSIAVPWRWRDRALELFDTAGLRRRARVTSKLEKLSAADALRAIDFAHIVVLLLDATAPLEKQDLTIAARALDEGRGVVIAINKWDLVEDRREAMGRVRDRLQTSLPQAGGPPVVTLSALTGKGVEKLLPASFALYDKWRVRVPTAQLNRWLEDTLERHPPPLGANGRRIRIRYMTQAKSRPPTFVAFASTLTELPESYLRYLQHGLREAFDLAGVPVRILLRKPKNPYD
jgi:GTP-binding protein